MPKATARGTLTDKADVLLVAVLGVVALSPWLGRVTRFPVPTVQFVLGCLLAVVPAAGVVNVHSN